MDWKSIDWSDPSAKISNHFTVKEATYLPKWDICHSPSDDEKKEIVRLAAIVDLVRDYFAAPINVHVWIRPNKANIPGNENDGGDYNKLIGGASNSAHIYGMAVDFDISGIKCIDAQQRMNNENKLVEWNLRCEDNGPLATWVHLDTRPVPAGGHRWFVA